MCSCRIGWTNSNSSIQARGLALHTAIFILKYELPRELIGAGGAGIPSGATYDGAGNLVVCCRAFSVQFTEDLVIFVVRPYGSPDQTGHAVTEYDCISAKTNSRA